MPEFAPNRAAQGRNIPAHSGKSGRFAPLRCDCVGDCCEFFKGQRLAPHRRGEAAVGQKRCDSRFAKRGEAGNQRVGERLPPLGKGGADDPEEQRLVRHRAGRGGSGLERDDRGGHLGLGVEAMGRNVEEELRVRVPLDKERKGAVIGRVRRGADPPRDLALDHDGDRLEAARADQRG